MKKEAHPLEVTALDPVSNDAAVDIALSEPFFAKISVEGSTPILFHRWSVEAIEEKAKTAKGSKGKKTDNVESYVWRDEEKRICIPGEYLRQACIHAAKFRQDPRSPRKSAMDLFKAALIVQTELSPILIGPSYKPTTKWEFIDQRRVQVQRAGITRMRPAFLKGWRATFELGVLLPEYIGRDVLLDVLTSAGKLIGIADNRPTYGRFQVVEFKA